MLSLFIARKTLCFPTIQEFRARKFQSCFQPSPKISRCLLDSIAFIESSLFPLLLLFLQRRLSDILFSMGKFSFIEDFFDGPPPIDQRSIRAVFRPSDGNPSL